MYYSSYKFSRKKRVISFAILIVFLLPYQCDCYTEVFSITKDANDNTYFVGNRDSDFFIGKRNSFCALQWESTAGSTSGDDNDNGNSEVLYNAVLGQDGAVYAVGSTHGSFSSPSNEVPNMDAAVLVYDSSSGNVLRQKQYDIAADLDNVAQAISQKANGNILVAVYGSVPNIKSIATYETRILEIDSGTLEVEKVYEIVVTTTENVFSITGGPKLLDFKYEESTNSIIALGHILGRGMLLKYSFDSEGLTNQVEWGEAFGNFQISAFTSDGNGAYYVVGSSSERVLQNDDLQTTVSAEYHAYVIRFDNIDSSNVSPTWVRQLAGSGSSQSGSDIAIDPVTGDIVVVGEFDADFTVTDVQTSETFSLNLSTDDGITDVFLWYLDASTGDFKELRSSSVANTNLEDRGNTISVLSERTVQIGGITNDGDDSTSTVCDVTNTLQSPTPSSSPSPSMTPSSTPSISSSPSSTPSPSQTASPTMTPLESIVPSLTSNPSPSRILLSPGASTSPSSSIFASASGVLTATASISPPSSPFSSISGTIAANSSPSPLTSRTSPSPSKSLSVLEALPSNALSSSVTSNPSEFSPAEQVSQIAILDISDSLADSSQEAVPAFVPEPAKSSQLPVVSASESLFVDLGETDDSNMFDGPDVSADLIFEDIFNAFASVAPTTDGTNLEEPETPPNEETSPTITMELQLVATAGVVMETTQVSRSQEVTATDDVPFLNIDMAPSVNERDHSTTESPSVSSDAVLVSFLSATPSSSLFPIPSFSGMVSLSPIPSPNLYINDDPSVSASIFDFSPQLTTPQANPSVTFTFVSVDLGTPTPSPSSSAFTGSSSDSSLEGPSRTFDFVVVDLGISLSPSTSSFDTAIDVNLISPTPSSSKIALLGSLGTITPGFTQESSLLNENEEKAGPSTTQMFMVETAAITSDPIIFPSQETFPPDEVDDIALISIMPEPSKLFSGDDAARSSEAGPTSFDTSVDPSSTPLPTFTMAETSNDAEDAVKSIQNPVESGVDEIEISPLLSQIEQTVSMSPLDVSTTMSPLVSEVVNLNDENGSTSSKDVEITGEPVFTSENIHLSRATPEDIDDISFPMTELSPIPVSPSLTVLDVSSGPLSSVEPKLTTVFKHDDADGGDEEEDMTSSALPSFESSLDQTVKETPMFTQTRNTGSMNSLEFSVGVTPIISQTLSTQTVESPELPISRDQTGIKPSETFHVSEETSLFPDISSSPDVRAVSSDTTATDFLQSPETSHATAEALPVPTSEASKEFIDIASFTTTSPDVKSTQVLQVSENALEPSAPIFSQFVTPLAVSTEATEKGLDTGTEPTHSSPVQQSTGDLSVPNERMEASFGFTNPKDFVMSSSEAKEEREILQTSVEDEIYMGGQNPGETSQGFHTAEEDVLEAEPKPSIAPDFTAFAEPLSGSSPSVFATAFPDISEIPAASPQTSEESTAQDILTNNSPQAMITSTSLLETTVMPSMDTNDELNSLLTASISPSSEFTNPQGFRDSASSPTAPLEEIQFKRTTEPSISVDDEQQMVSITPDSLVQFTAMVTISPSLEQSTLIPSASQAAKLSPLIEYPAPSEDFEIQGTQSNALEFSETPLPSAQPSAASIQTTIEYTPLWSTESIPFESNDARMELFESPGAETFVRGESSQEPSEGAPIEFSATPIEITISASGMQSPTPDSESVSKHTIGASRAPATVDFTPGLAASILVESPESENSRSQGTASSSITPQGTESLQVSVSVSVTITPRPSVSITSETNTPVATGGVPREPAFSFIDIVFPSATPSSSPTIRTGTLTASPTSDVITASISADVSRASPSLNPVSSEGIVPSISSSVVGSRTSTPSASMNPSDAVLIVLPSATPSSSLAVFIVLPSATPSSSLAIKGSTSTEPSSTAIESQQTESVLPTASVRFTSSPVETPKESNVLPSLLASPSTSAQSASPSSADRDFLSIAPTFQGLESPSVSKAFLPGESTKPRFSESAVQSAVPSQSSTKTSLETSTGSPVFLPSRFPLPSSTGTEGSKPSPSNQSPLLETPTESISVSILPSSTVISKPNPVSPTQTAFLGTPTREPGESVQPTSNEDPTFKPSIPSLPSLDGNMTEIPSISPQPTAQGGLSSASPTISGSTVGFASQTFFLEQSAFPSMAFSIFPSDEANFEEPTASLLPSKMELIPISSETPEKTGEAIVTEEMTIQTPATSQDMDGREEEASVTPQPMLSFSGEVEISTTPSSLPSPTSALTASGRPTVSSTAHASPTISGLAISSPSPRGACVADGNIIVDQGTLNQTRNFQRVNMVIQIAGPNLTGSCQFTGAIAERFIILSAINTLSQADMWHIISIENGPPVFEEESTLVGIEDGDPFPGEPAITSPSPSSNATKSIRFEGSVIFNVTAFMDSLSVELASGSYVEYINSQNIVKVMTAEGFDDIQWTGMISTPRVIDFQIQEEDTRAESGGLTSGEISAVAVGVLLIVGVAAFVIVEGGISTRRSGAILPI